MKRIVFISIALVVLLAGCSVSGKGNPAAKEYSFENSDVITYVEGEPVSEASMNSYIIMKKAYMDALAASIEEETDVDELMFTEKIIYEWDVERTRDIKRYSEHDWVMDYYKSVYLCKEYDKLDMHSEEQLEFGVDSIVIDILESQNHNQNDLSGLADDGIIVEVINEGVDEALAVQVAADQLGITFEECLNTVFKPFLISESKYTILLNMFHDEVKYNKKIEYDGNNDSEYVVFVLTAMEINRNYLNSLFEKAEIVERP